MEQTVLLRMTDITKTFPGVKALDHVSLEVKAGTAVSYTHLTLPTNSYV